MTNPSSSRIIDSDIPTSSVEFTDVVEIINRFSDSDYLKEWIRVQNNFIGFCVGAKNSLLQIKTAKLSSIERALQSFEQAFSSINVSKVNLGKVRRELVAFFINDFGNLSKLDEFELLDKISDRI